jgi:hypothetical protein
MVAAKSAAGAESDAEQARQYTFGLDDATPARYAAVTAVLIGQFNADADRIQAARAVAADRCHSEPGACWPETVALLDAALGKIRAAGVGADDRAALLEELWPAAQPYEWPMKRRQSLRWQLRRAWLRLHVRATTARVPWLDTGYKTEISAGRRIIGTMQYQLCPECRIGHILKIAIDDRYKGYGLGTRTVLRLHNAYPGYVWHTTAQYDTSGTFWTALAKRTGSAFTADQHALCTHLRHDLPHR